MILGHLYSSFSLLVAYIRVKKTPLDELKDRFLLNITFTVRNKETIHARFRHRNQL